MGERKTQCFFNCTLPCRWPGVQITSAQLLTNWGHHSLLVFNTATSLGILFVKHLLSGSDAPKLAGWISDWLGTALRGGVDRVKKKPWLKIFRKKIKMEFFLHTTPNLRKKKGCEWDSYLVVWKICTQIQTFILHYFAHSTETLIVLTLESWFQMTITKILKLFSVSAQFWFQILVTVTPAPTHTDTDKITYSSRNLERHFKKWQMNLNFNMRWFLSAAALSHYIAMWWWIGFFLKNATIAECQYCFMIVNDFRAWFSCVARRVQNKKLRGGNILIIITSGTQMHWELCSPPLCAFAFLPNAKVC